MSQWQWGVYEDLNSVFHNDFFMNEDALSGRSILIGDRLTEQQKTLIDKGLAYSFFHKVPTQNQKVNYLRATIKGNLSKRPTKIMQSGENEFFAIDNDMKIKNENPKFGEIRVGEGFFVHLENNFAATLSPNSKLMKFGKDFKLKAIALKDIKKGDTVAIIKNMPTSTDQLISSDKARFLMLMAGDGHVTKTMNRFFITSGDDEILENFSELTYNLYGKKAKIAKPYANAYSTKICKELTGLYSLSSPKLNFRIPESILKSDENIILSALGGLIDTDGNIFWKTGQLRIDTSSYNMAIDIATLFMKLHIFPSINQGRSTYGVRAQICQKQAKRISEFVFSHRKKDSLLKITDPKKSQEFDLTRVDGKELAKLRKSHGYTQYSFGKKIGTHPGLLSDWERNVRKQQVKKLEQIALICQNKNLLNLASSPITTVKIKAIEKMQFENSKKFLIPKTSGIFINNFILTKFEGMF